MAAAAKNMTSQVTQYENWAKKTGSVVEWSAHKTTEATIKSAKVAVKVASKTSQPAGPDQAGKFMMTSVSMGQQ